MILQRLSESIRKQDWFTVFIETLIVVLGVFLGIQLGNWNSARQERDLEQAYLTRLHDDFMRSVENAEDNIRVLEWQYRFETLMMEQLDQCTLDPAARADFERGMYLFGRLEPPPLVTDTIDELKATGRMEIIRDMQLRQQIGDTLRRQVSNAQVLDYIVARATPHIHYIDQRVVNWLPETGLDPLVDPIPEGAFQYDFDALCSDTKYVGSVSFVREATKVVLRHNRDRKEDYLKAIELLDAAQ